MVKSEFKLYLVGVKASDRMCGNRTNLRSKTEYKHFDKQGKYPQYKTPISNH